MINKDMRAIITSNGKTCYTVQAPMPELTRVRNVLVKVCCAGICRTDLGIANGTVAHRDGIIMGHELCGTIEAFYNSGSSCDGWRVGETVGCNPMMFGETDAEEVMCGKDVDGAFAEYIVVPSRALVGLPPHLLSPLGAYLEPVAAALAPIQLIQHRFFDEDVCVFGDNRIAELTLQVGHVMGMKALKRVRHLEELEPNSYDCIIETEPQHLDAYVRALRPKGTLVLKSRSFQPSQLTVNAVAMKEITIQGARYGDFGVASHILAATAAGVGLDTAVLLGECYELWEYEKAFEEAGKEKGKKVFIKAE